MDLSVAVVVCLDSDILYTSQAGKLACHDLLHFFFFLHQAARSCYTMKWDNNGVNLPEQTSGMPRDLTANPDWSLWVRKRPWGWNMCAHMATQPSVKRESSCFAERLVERKGAFQHLFGCFLKHHHAWSKHLNDFYVGGFFSVKAASYINSFLRTITTDFYDPSHFSCWATVRLIFVVICWSFPLIDCLLSLYLQPS